MSALGEPGDVLRPVERSVRAKRRQELVGDDHRQLRDGLLAFQPERTQPLERLPRLGRIVLQRLRNDHTAHRHPLCTLLRARWQRQEPIDQLEPIRLHIQVVLVDDVEHTRAEQVGQSLLIHERDHSQALQPRTTARGVVLNIAVHRRSEPTRRATLAARNPRCTTRPAMPR
jgi:hypothetical protein